MKWIIISALRISIYLGAVATIAGGALTGYVGGLSIENFPVTGIAGAIVGGVAGVLLAGLVFGTLTVLLDIRDNLADLRDRDIASPSDPEPRQEPRQEPQQEPRETGRRKEPFFGNQ
ncbi:MAG: hypothetical protein RIB59_17930 [Rhodospirillales bacterium]